MTPISLEAKAAAAKFAGISWSTDDGYAAALEEALR